jgi:hypothetical protein
MPNLYNKEVVAELNPAMYANGMANKAAHANDIAYTVLTLFENIHPLPVSPPPPPPPKSTSVSANETDFLPVVEFVVYFSAMADFPPPEKHASGGAFGFPNIFLLLVFLTVAELLFFVTIGLISLQTTTPIFAKRAFDE